jgi:L-ascorbate oxidase
MRALGLTLAAAAFVVAAPFSPPAHAGTYDLSIGAIMVDVSGTPRPGLAINGSIPAPTLRFKEGEDLVINVTNTLAVDSSIHWHGLILPNAQDGVPGLTFDGIAPGTTHTYRFPAQQSGTYWYHSHSGLQEQSGLYGAIVIDAHAREPFRYDREYVVVLSDWHDSPPEQILANLKKQSDYYNYQQRTVFSFFDDVEEDGFAATLADRLDWGEMRMTPTDITDVSGYTFLINGKSPEQNWTALFEPGDRVRLRFINAAAMTYFDVRIPGLQMTVVQADGNNVQPVKVDEFRIAVAETYDVIVRPKQAGPFTIFAESMSRTGHARATLAVEPGVAAAVPTLRQPPLLSMADMGAAHAGMDHGDMAGMDHGDMAEMDHGAMTPTADPFYAPGSGLLPQAADGGRFLSYTDLKAQKPLYAEREPDREIEIRLTGNMERYIWSINDLKYSQAQPIRLTLGERVRFKFVNETMMTHPMHLHGMWSILDVGAGKWNPAKHTISVSPGTTVYAEVEADAPGRWAFHCHLMYHMASGMFREVLVEGGPQTATLD